MSSRFLIDWVVGSEGRGLTELNSEAFWVVRMQEAKHKTKQELASDTGTFIREIQMHLWTAFCGRHTIGEQKHLKQRIDLLGHNIGQTNDQRVRTGTGSRQTASKERHPYCKPRSQPQKGGEMVLITAGLHQMKAMQVMRARSNFERDFDCHSARCENHWCEYCGVRCTRVPLTASRSKREIAERYSSRFK